MNKLGQYLTALSLTCIATPAAAFADTPPAQTAAPAASTMSAQDPSVVGAAFPTLSPFFGASGLGVMPTTATVAPGAMQLGLSGERSWPAFGGQVDFLPSVSANVGFKNGEAGVSYLYEDGHNGTHSNNFAAQGKYVFYDNPESQTSVAVGMHFFKPEGHGTDTSIYITGGMPIGMNKMLRLEAGGVLQFVYLPGPSTTVIRPMVGLDYRGFHNLTLGADYIPNVGAEPQLFSVLARYQCHSGIGAEVGYGQQFTNDKRVFAALAYTFSAK